MEFGEQAIRWLELLIERRMLLIELKGVHLATDDGKYWSHFSWPATYVQVRGDAIRIVYDLDEERRLDAKAREGDEEAPGE